MAASAALAAGSTSRVNPRWRASAATDSTPRVGSIEPSSDSSPMMIVSAIVRAVTTPVAARTPSAIGRSKAVPALRTSAGARLTVTRCSGKSKPELRIADRTRSRLSRTLASGRPTSTSEGSPKVTSTSTSTGMASRPKRAADRRDASMPVRARARRGTGASGVEFVEDLPGRRGECGAARAETATRADEQVADSATRYSRAA